MGTWAHAFERARCQPGAAFQVKLKHCFYSHTEKDETYLHLVLEFVPDTVYRISKHYAKNNQRMPNIFVKLYAYQVRCLWHAHNLTHIGARVEVGGRAFGGSSYLGTGLGRRLCLRP